MRQPSSLFLLAFLLTRAGSLPLFSRATFSSRTTATEGAELGLGGPSAAEPLAEDTRGENHAKAPHCRDTKADCQHAKIKARAKKAAKLTAAEQAETKKQNHTTILPTFAGFSAAIVAKHKATRSTSAPVHHRPVAATRSTSAPVHHRPVAATRYASAPVHHRPVAVRETLTWSRFDRDEDHEVEEEGEEGEAHEEQGYAEKGHEDRSGHVGARVRAIMSTLSTTRGAKPFRLFSPGAYYP